MTRLDPIDGPARLMRYVEPGTLPGKNILAIYDKDNNLLIIDREKFGTLTKLEQRALLRTHEPVTYWQAPFLSEAAE